MENHQPSRLLPVARHDLIKHQFGDDMVIHDELNARLHVLNGPAMRIFCACNGTVSEQTLLAAFTKEYPEVDARIIESDIRLAVEKLRREGLFE